MRKNPPVIAVILFLLVILPVLIGAATNNNTNQQKPLTPQTTNNPSTWTPLDTSESDVDVIGEKTGSLEEQSFAGWYTDTVIVDPDTGTIIAAWARWNGDTSGNDYIYLSFLKPIDTDNDEAPEAYQKTIKLVAKTTSLKSLDSLTLGKINGQPYILITWTYYDSSTYRNDVAGAILALNSTLLWKGDIANTTYYDEFSKSCYVPAYNNNNGGFLIIWYTSQDKSIDGKWLYYDSSWKLSDKIDITYTRSLDYQKADQLLCIGGQNKALVVYRYLSNGDIGLDARLVDETGSSSFYIVIYDNDNYNESIGVKGAYITYSGEGYFIVPFTSGNKIGYTVVKESATSWREAVITRETLSGNGEHPYIIALNDRFVAAWIDHYNDNDGEPKIANIDLTNFETHPTYGKSVTGGDNYYDKHPLIAYDSNNGKLVYIWSNSTSDTGDYDVKYALISLGNPTDEPSIDTTDVLIKDVGDQKAHGFGLVSEDQFVVVYTDTSDGEEDLLAYVVMPDSEDVPSIQVYRLPADGDSYKQKIIDLIDNAISSVYVAVAFFAENNPGGSDTISGALVNAKNRGVDVRVILDNSTGNKPMYGFLKNNGISVINDTSANDDSHIMHDKFIVIDNNTVIVSTANLEPSEFYQNNNTAIVIDSRAVAYFYACEFMQMWNNGNGLFGEDKTSDYSFIAFTTYNSRTIVFEGYFSPQWYGDVARIPGTIAGYINRTGSGVYFASYIFTTSGWVTPVYNALISMHSIGKTVKGVFNEELNVDTPGKRLYWFIDNSTPIAIDNHPYNMHAKLFVVDNETAVIGSWNPTGSATTDNDENILVIRDSDTTNGFAEQIAEQILSMYNSDLFVKSPYQYDPTHLVITKVMFEPDTTGDPTNEWVEIYNPTDQTISLFHYVIGDAEDLIDGDSDPDDGLYVFPDDASIPPGGYIVIAYDASAFSQAYSFKPDYEIAGTDDTVPDLTKYDAEFGTNKFPGSWNLADSGDEVILGVDQGGFIVVVDAVWYGDSVYMKTSIGQPDSAAPLDTSSINPGDGIVNKKLTGNSNYYDAIKMSDKYEIESNPQPIPEPILTVLIAIITVIVVIVVYWAKRRI